MPDGRELSKPHTARRPTAERGLSTKVEPENGHSSAATRARVRCDQVQTSPQPRQPAQLREPKPSDTPMGVSRVPTSVVYGQCNGDGPWFLGHLQKTFSRLRCKEYCRVNRKNDQNGKKSRLRISKVRGRECSTHPTLIRLHHADCGSSRPLPLLSSPLGVGSRAVRLQ